MQESYLMAIDAGTVAVRCVLTDSKGENFISSYKEWNYQPSKIHSTGIDFDPKYFWQLTCETIKDVLKKSKISPEKIAAISSTSQRGAMVFLDKEGKELYAGPNVDSRALTEDWIDFELKKEIYFTSGQWLSTISAPCRMAWFEKNDKEIFEKVDKIISMSDWVLYKLSGEIYSEPSNGCVILPINLEKISWSKDILNRFNLSVDILPELLPSGTVIGKISEKISQETGLSRKTLVVTGGADTQCALLGTGAIENKDTTAVAGTWCPIQMVLDKVVIDKKLRAMSECHVVPNKWILESSALMFGLVYRWFKETFCFEEKIIARDKQKKVYKVMDERAKKAPIGAEGLFSFIGVGIMDMSRKSLITEGSCIIPPTTFISGIPGKNDFFFFLIESMAYAIRANCEELEEISGVSIKELRICGGNANNELLLNILSSLLDRPIITVKNKEATSVGSVICAGVGSGIYSNFKEGVQQLVKYEDKIIEPQKKDIKQYNVLYSRWRDLYDKNSMPS